MSHQDGSTRVLRLREELVELPAERERGSALLALSLAVLDAQPPPLEITSPVAAQVDLRISYFQRDPDLLLLESYGEVSLDAPDLPEASIWLDDAHASVAFRLLPGETLTTFLPDGRGLELTREGRQLGVVELARRAPDVLEEVRVDTSDWWAPDAPGWLRAEVDQYQLAGAYGAVAAVGVYFRLSEPEQPGGSAALLAELMAGGVDPVRERVERWAGGLSPGQLTALCDLAVVEVVRLHRVAEDAEGLGGEDLQDAVLDLARSRDTLEGIRAVLALRGQEEALDAQLEVLDEDLRLLLRALPEAVAVDDERLAAVWVRDPSAWWAEPARAF